MSSALKGIAYIHIPMNDFERTVKFYTKLGLTVTYEDKPSFVSFSFEAEPYTELLCSTDAKAQPGETGIMVKLLETANLWE